MSCRLLPVLDGLNAYLVVQDGVTASDVLAAVDGFGGLFVGGSLPWKLATSAAWVDVAHELGRPLHIGRVGTVPRLRWAREIGADSVDSCLPLWRADRLDAWLAVLREDQGQLFGGVA